MVWEILAAVFAAGISAGLGLAQLIQMLTPYLRFKREKKHINSSGFFVEKEVISEQKGSVFLPDRKIKFKPNASWEEKLMRIDGNNISITKTLISAGLRIREKKDATCLFILSIINTNPYPIRDVGASVYFHPLFFNVESPVDTRHCVYDIAEDGNLFNVKCGELNFMENALVVIPVSLKEAMLEKPKDFNYFTECVFFLKYGKSRAHIDRGMISLRKEISTNGAKVYPIFPIDFASFPPPENIKQS